MAITDTTDSTSNVSMLKQPADAVADAEKQAQQELAEERALAAKTKIKAKLREIDNAARVKANLERELEVLKADLTVS